MTLRDQFRKEGIIIAEDNTIQIENSTITVYYDRNMHCIIVANNFDGLHEQCLTRSQAIEAVKDAASMIIKACLRDERNAIAEQCEEEGYPSHGSNYDLRVSQAESYYDDAYWWVWE